MIAWIKKNIILTVLLVIILLNFLKNILFGTNITSLSVPSQTDSYSGSTRSVNLSPAGSFSALSSVSVLPKTGGGYTAPSESTNRLVIQDTSLSLVVKNVADSIKEVQSQAEKNNGFLVNSYLNNPSESASGSIVVRIPESNRTQFLTSIKSIATKVVSENVSGTDVTDQYSDLDAQLSILNQTKQKYDEILAKAVSVQDLLTVQRELINLQSQIDSVKGQQKYYQQSAKLSKVTVYLSSDEYSLPYAPSDAWRPQVIFKQAVRSMIGTLRGLGSTIIWLIVYLPILAVAYFVYKFIKAKFFRSKSKTIT